MIIEKINATSCDCAGARKFGITFTLVLFFWGWVLLRHHNALGNNFFIAGCVIFFLALIYPVILRPLHKISLLLGICAGFLFTGVILAGVFYLVVTPIAIFAGFRGKKFMKNDFNRKSDSYWEKSAVIDVDKESYKKQY
jgi:predicted membrane protein